ncbi:MAG TPA: hypothetical protein VG872_10890 [Acidimicrobiia bacterium]|jgi:hypothetical protein|nr:hypothetical protein [Acidimicrobiia bacterium]
MKLLEIYLDDHWAGAGAGRSLARRLARNNAGTDWAWALEEVMGEIEEDDRTLETIRDRLGVTGGGVKRSLAQVGERVARLKLNGRLVTYSPLSKVLEVEALIAGVSAKRLLWTALGEIAANNPALAGFGFADLEQRADAQLATLRRFHRDAVTEAFAEDGSLRS